MIAFGIDPDIKGKKIFALFRVIKAAMNASLCMFGRFFTTFVDYES